MGLLSFLSSRKSSDRLSRSSGSVRGYAYDASAPSFPPVQGTYPMAGNGPANALETLQRSRPLHGDSDRALDVESEKSAPAPVVPRFRDLAAGDERPSTAPTGDADAQRVNARGRRETLKQRPLRPRKLKSDSVSSTPKSMKGTACPPLAFPFATPTPGSPSHSKPPSIVGAQQRSNSIISFGSGKGFVDLLDAQSELKPLNFHSRLKAAGARDYGEDVADRNVGANGADLTSPQAQAFYALTGTNPCGLWGETITPSNPSSSWRGARPLVPPPMGEYTNLAVRESQIPFINPLTQHPAAATQEFHDNEPEARLSRHLSQKDRASRRQSLSSYVPAPANTHSPQISRTKKTHKASRSGPLSSQDLRAVQTPNLPANEPNFNSVDLYSHLIPKLEPEPPLSPSFARDSVILARTNYSLPSNSRTAQRPYRERSGTETFGPGEAGDASHPAAARQHSRSREGSISSTVRGPRRKGRRHTLREDIRTASAAQEAAHELVSPNFAADGLSTDSALPPQVKREGRTRKFDRPDASYSQMMNLSPVAYGRLRLDEIFEHIPVRTSSLNQWSVSSNTPTMSSSTSSAAPATRSRHTPDTSIDMGMEPSRKTLGGPSPGAEDIGSGPDDASASACSYWTALEDADRGGLDWQGSNDGERDGTWGNVKEKNWETEGNGLPGVALASPTYEATTFSSIHDCLTSDDDEDDREAYSNGGSRLTTGELEGELLFQEERYGGLRLPGLFDPLTALPKAESTSGLEGDEGPDSLGGEGDLKSETNGDYSDEWAPELEPAPIPRNRRSNNNEAIEALEMDHRCHDDYEIYDHDDDATLKPSAHAHGYGFSANDEHLYVRNPAQRDVPNNMRVEEAADYDNVNNRDEGVSSARADLAPGKKGSRRISTLGKGPQVAVAPPTPIMEEESPVNEVVRPVEEEQCGGEGREERKEDRRRDKRDIKTAVRLRKEAKAKARARGAGGQAKPGTTNRQFGSNRVERNSIMRVGLEAGP